MLRGVKIADINFPGGGAVSDDFDLGNAIASTQTARGLRQGSLGFAIGPLAGTELALEVKRDAGDYVPFAAGVGASRAQLIVGASEALALGFIPFGILRFVSTATETAGAKGEVWVI